VTETVNAATESAFGPAATYPGAGDPYSVAVVDLNGDGRPDLVEAEYGNVAVLLGNSDGTFQPLVGYGAASTAWFVTTGDFNGDGKADVVVSNLGDGTVSVLLGNGDGTLQAPVNYFAGPQAFQIAVADFNGDGTADLAVGIYGSDTVSLLLGNGDGTFQPAANFAVGLFPLALAAGDFNGDGKADLAVATANIGLGVFLGNGDGTFQTGMSYVAGRLTSLVAVDLNGDGKVDLAAPDYYNNYTSVFLGNGDGTFRAALNYPVGSHPSSVAVGDFNGDGKLDLVTSNYGTWDVSILLGNGNGTFQPPANYNTGPNPESVAVGDFNGDGRTDLAVADLSFDGSTSILLGVLGTTAQTITFGPLGNVAPGAAPITISAMASSGLTVIFASNTLSVCTVSGTLVTILASGGRSITASQPGSATYAPATPITQTFTVYFNDVQPLSVDPSDFYYNAINLFAQYGITAGCGNNNFCPGQNVTRAQMAIFIIRAIFGNANFPYSTTPHFADVGPSDFGFKWIQAMYELGISAGCGNGNYCPNDSITRAQMAVFITAARFEGTTFDYPSTPYFTDVLPPSEDPSDVFFKFVQRMKTEGITSGCTATTFCPASPVTRGQMAVFIMVGLFNQLLQPATPLIAQISPAALAPGTTGTFIISGTNTHFVQGTSSVMGTTLSPIPGVTIGAITVNSPTSLTLQLSAAADAVIQPRSLLVITGSEEAVLPNGLSIQ
jgi:FG-GAP-like repeat/S-layer homology domain